MLGNLVKEGQLFFVIVLLNMIHDTLLRCITSHYKIMVQVML